LDVKFLKNEDSSLKRKKLLKDRVNFAVKIRDYTAEAIYVLTSEILELEKLFIMHIAMQT
jgi:hypothetical protein